MATVKFKDKEGGVRVRKIPSFGSIDCTGDDFGFSSEMSAQSAGVAPEGASFWGSVSITNADVATSAGAEGERREAAAALRPRRQAICGRGRVNPSTPSAAGPGSGVSHATAAARHSLG